MTYRIVCVGKIKEKYFTDAINEYVKRLSRFVKTEIVEVEECLFKGVPNASEINGIIEKEGKELEKELKGTVIVLAVEGQELSSQDFSKKLCALRQNNSTFTFVIGGSYGLSDAVKRKADLMLSFGRITLPHQLCRVVLCEQLYRALTIENNVPYHK